jgi:pilus assembly protein Flp/PilA
MTIDRLRLTCVRIKFVGLSFAKDRRAVTAIEYALIAALIAVVIIGGVAKIGTRASTTFNTIATEL